ncbi:MAG: hypothetical protein HRU31_10585 [Rhodobacteraceae bacterium]|nr:hypothetical protein [Paracoccaceae bacterium]
MTLTSIGDLATQLIIRNRNTALRSELQTLTDELSTGVTHDVHARVGGDYSYLAQIDRDLERLEGYSLAAGETTVMFAAANQAVSRVTDLMVDLADDLIAPVQLTGATQGRLAVEAREMLRESMASLSVQSAGRFVFSGKDVDAAPLADVDDLLTDLSAAIAAETNAADILTAAEAWFDDPTGFDAVVYGGANASLDPIRVGINAEVDMSVRADDDRFKRAFRTMALTSLMTDTTLGFSDATILDLSNLLLSETLAAQTDLSGLQADLGFATERLSIHADRNTSETLALTYARGELLAANPYETAVALQNVQTQLDSFYTVLSRSSGLSLVNYLS